MLDLQKQSSDSLLPTSGDSLNWDVDRNFSKTRKGGKKKHGKGAESEASESYVPTFESYPILAEQSSSDCDVRLYHFTVTAASLILLWPEFISHKPYKT